MIVEIPAQGGKVINDLGIIEQELGSIQEAAAHEKSGHEVFCHPSPGINFTIIL